MSLGFDNARHLLSRTSFGGDLNTVEAYANHTNAKAAVRALLKTARTQSFRPAPRWLNEPPPTRKERRANPKTFRKRSRERALEIKNGWYT
ncbi:MAG: hypothetical protein AAFS10_13050, partial [Myxococcota bacterium]